MNKNKILYSLLFFPLVITNISKNSTTVSTSVKSEASGSSSSVETKIITNTNGKETIVESNQPGSISVEVKDGKTEIKTSKDITPTIIVKEEKPNLKIGESNPTPQEIEVTREEIKAQFKEIFEPLRNLFRSIFSWFNR